MGLVNRFALLAFPLPTVVLLLQMVATLAILYPFLRAGVLTFPMFQYARFVQLLGLGMLYTSNIAFALFGLKTLNLPMYTALKLLTPATTLVIKVSDSWLGHTVVKQSREAPGC
jgi:solute carrier family 35 protein